MNSKLITSINNVLFYCFTKNYYEPPLSKSVAENPGDFADDMFPFHSLQNVIRLQ